MGLVRRVDNRKLHRQEFEPAPQISFADTARFAPDILACTVESGDNKGTISVNKPRLWASNSVRQHRVISVSYSYKLRCHGTAKGNERKPHVVGKNRRVFAKRGRSSAG